MTIAFDPVRSLARHVVCAMVGWALILMATAARADSFDIVVKLSDTLTQTVWRIEAPNVKQKQTDYPQILFAPGDNVSVAAGGCVQTGGIGLTWKRYVDPSGPNAGHLYHGLISIPGVTTGLVRLQDFGLNMPKIVSATSPAGAAGQGWHLRLGYEDDGYGDNGYYKHDNGTQDQCRSRQDAFVIISIGHHGTSAGVASNFDGIPPNLFRCQAGWAFANFDTGRLSLASFRDAFDFQVTDYLDAATGIIFLALRDNLASGGNCMGMSLLAVAGEDQFLVDDVHENMWTNYKTLNVTSPKLVRDINTAHWQQLSEAFLHAYLNNVVKSPSDNAQMIARDLTQANYNYGLISIAHGSEGHILVPLSVTRSGGIWHVGVYDSNRPCTSVPDTANNPTIDIDGDHWSYDMGGSVWSGTTAHDGLAYVPYTGSSGWRVFGANFTGIVAVVFGNNVDVQQVEDSRGRKLFVDGTGALDTSATGLGRSVFKLPSFHQASGHRPRISGSRLTTISTTVVPPAAAAFASQLEAEYGADYAGSHAVYLVTDASLSDLRFRVAAVNASQPLRAVVHQGGQFYELRVTGAAQALRSAAIVLRKPSALAAQGLSLEPSPGQQLVATLTSGTVAGGVARLQHMAPLTISTPLRISGAGASLVLANSQSRPSVALTEELIAPNSAAVRQVRSVAISADNLPR